MTTPNFYAAEVAEQVLHHLPSDGSIIDIPVLRRRLNAKQRLWLPDVLDLLEQQGRVIVYESSRTEEAVGVARPTRWRATGDDDSVRHASTESAWRRVQASADGGREASNSDLLCILSCPCDECQQRTATQILADWVRMGVIFPPIPGGTDTRRGSA